MKTLNKTNEKAGKPKLWHEVKITDGYERRRNVSMNEQKKWRNRYYELKTHGCLTTVKEYHYPLELM